MVRHQDWADPWHGAAPDVVLGADLLYDPGELHSPMSTSAGLFQAAHIALMEH